MRYEEKQAIRNARVNISVDVNLPQGTKNIELPFKVLALGNYSGKKNPAPLSARKRIPINHENFNAAIKNLAPEVDLVVENKIQNNGRALKTRLKFEHLEDFSPERVVAQVPELRKLLACRNLLKDLRANLIDNKTLKQRLEAILLDEEKQEALKNELEAFA